MTEDLIDIVLENEVQYIKKRNISSFFNLDYFESFLKRQKLEFFGIKDPAIENSRIPTLAQAFYEVLIYYNKIPTQKSFANYYYKRNCISAPKQMFTFKKGTVGGFALPKQKLFNLSLQSRLYRAYPSLIRDFHFFLMCQNSNKFENVKFSLKEDFATGCDLTVILKNKTEVKVRLFINSKRALSFLKKKHKIHTYEGLFVDIPLNMKKSKTIGDFKVYDETHIEILLKAGETNEQ